MWWSLLPQIVLAAVLLILPGLLVALAVRIRGFDALALAPALSTGIIVVTSTLTPFVQVRFGMLPVAVVSLLVAAAGFFAARFRTGNSGRPAAQAPLPRPRALAALAPFAAFGMAAALLAASAARGIGTPQSFSQTYDAVFHLNSLKFAMDTGQASSLTIGDMTGGGAYPAGWNAVAALVASISGADVPTTANITSIILAAVFWPLGCLLLSRWTVGRRVAATLGVGIACASLGAFPILMMDFGVLYPNLLAISVLPASVALAASLAGLAPGQPRRDLAIALTLLLALAGLVVAHPTTFMAWLIWTLPMVAVLTWRSFGNLRRTRVTAGGAARTYVLSAAVYAAAFLALWTFLRPPVSAAIWGPYGTVPQAFGEALAASPGNLPPAWLVAPLALLGLWVCFKFPGRFAWLGVVFVLFTGLYVVVAGFPKSPLRDWVSGIWYNDTFRVAALLPAVTVVLVAVGLHWAETALVAARGRHRALRLAVDGPAGWSGGTRAVYRGAGGLVLVLTAIVVGQQGGFKEAVRDAASHYRLDDESLLLSPDEAALIKRLPQTVPEDALLIGNPYTGSSLSYALGDRKSAQLHVLSYVSPELEKIYESLGQVSTDPAVCQAIRKERAFYILDFGTNEVHEDGFHTPPGLRGLSRNPGVQLVDSEGGARLYRVTACGS